MIQRRHFVAAGAAAVASTLIQSKPGFGDAAGGPNPPASDAAVDAEDADNNVTGGIDAIAIGLNTSTIRGQKLSVPEQIDVASAGGFDAIEPWIRDLEAYRDAGGSITEIRRRIDDAGLAVCSAIGFAKWIVDDVGERTEALRIARRDMELVRSIGGTCIAAPPIGAHQASDDLVPLDAIAERFAALCEVGADVGVKPQLEVWGFSKNLSKLSDVAYVLTSIGRDDALFLPDFYHLHKGGNAFEGLHYVSAKTMQCFHINDYPDRPLDTLSDADRVYPGDGVCPLVDTIADLIRGGFSGTFSLELFNRDLWQQPADAVARTGAGKCRRVIDAAIAKAAR